MFKNLVEVIISINEHGICNTIIINNNKKDISLNGNYNNLAIQDYNYFIESFFRIIREWQNEDNKTRKDLVISVKIVEKTNQYTMSIEHYMPDNLDSFLDLIHNLN